MRMWMTPPKTMCREHLLGEHVELHMFIGTMRRGVSMDGYLDFNLLEPASLKQRHDELVAEMLARGYKHKSPLTPDALEEAQRSFKSSDPAGWHRTIDRDAAARELYSRCQACQPSAGDGSNTTKRSKQ